MHVIPIQDAGAAKEMPFIGSWLLTSEAVFQQKVEQRLVLGTGQAVGCRDRHPHQDPLLVLPGSWLGKQELPAATSAGFTGTPKHP